MRRYCKGGIDLKHTRRRVVRLSVTSEMGEGGREPLVSCQIKVLTKGFLQYDDGFVKAAKLDKGLRNASIAGLPGSCEWRVQSSGSLPPAAPQFYRHGLCCAMWSMNLG